MENNLPAIWDHQKKIIELATSQNSFAILAEMGTGKTRCMVEILRHIYNTEGMAPTLIVAPLITLSNWKEEILKYSKIPESEITLLTGEGRKRVVALERSKGNIFVVNYEGLLMARLFEEMLRKDFRTVVFDESHKLKKWNGKTTKQATILADKAYYRYIMTGTLVLNNILDVFAQFRLLDRGALLGTNYWAFRNTYMYDANSGMAKHNYFPNWKVKPGSVERLNQIMAKKSYRVDKKDCLTLPPFVQITIKVGMTPQQRKMYEDMKRDYIAFIETNTGVEAVVAQMGLVKALRLMQIASGFCKTDKGNEELYLDTPKDKALSELLEDYSGKHKIIVWAVFSKNYAAIRRVCGELNIAYREATGETTPREKDGNIHDFKTKDDVRVLIANPEATGIGINLVQSDISIFYSRNFSLGQSLQAEARNYRGGSEMHEKVTRIDLVCENSLEEKVQLVLANKKELSDKVLRTLVLD